MEFLRKQIKQSSTIQAKEHNRVKKGVGLVAGALLASTFVLSNGYVVSADEVSVNPATSITVTETGTDPEPAKEEVHNDSLATNLETVQPTPTTENTQSVADAGKQTGEIVTPVENSSLNNAVSEAKDTGVVIEEKEKMITNSFKEAEAKLNEQENRVKEATSTQKELDSVQANAEKEAKSAGVELKTSTEKIYKDNNKAALVDANMQAGQLSEATKAQNQVNESLPTAVKSSKDLGVSIVVEAGVKYEDATKALADLTQQVATLQTAKQTQADLDAAIAIAIAEAKKSGVNVTLSSTKTTAEIQSTIADIQSQLSKVAETVRVKQATADQIAHAETSAKASGVKVTKKDDVTYQSNDEAIKAAKAQEENLAKASQAQKTSDQILADAKVNAAANDTTVNVTGTKELTANQAQAEAQKQADKVAAVIKENKDAETKYQSDLKAYEDEKTRLEKEYNDALKAYNEQVAAIETSYTNDLAKYEDEKNRLEKEYNEAVVAWEKEVARIKEADSQKQGQYQNDAARVSKENEEIQARNAAAEAKYKADLATYEKAKAEYDQKVKEAEANVGKEGYLSRVEAQKLIFKSEPNAVISVSQPEASDMEISSTSRNRDIGQFRADSSNAPVHVLRKDSPVTVTYSSLQNSFYDSNKIDKVEFTYSLISTNLDNRDKILISFQQDPTRTVYYWADGNETAIEIDVKFFDKNGNQMQTDGSLISFASLNTSNFGQDYESVSNFNGEFVEINGSSIKVVNGVAVAQGSNGFVEQGSRFPEQFWDKDGSNYEYYGAIVGKAKGNDIKFTTSSKGRSYVWFAFNTNLKTLGGELTPPTPPTKPTPEPLKKTPDPLSETVLPPKPTEPTPKEAPVKKEYPKTPPTPELPKSPEKLAPKPVDIENIQVVTESHNVNLETTITPITLEAKTHGIQMVVPVHDVRVATTVNPVEVKQAPTNTKAATNAEGLNINTELVVKGSTVEWVLSNEALKAGRDQVTEYRVTDALPKGFVLNLKDTATKSSDWTVDYSRENHTIVFTLKDNKVMDLNTDLTAVAQIPVIKIVGTVVNDGATYENTFVTDITMSETVIRDKDGKLVPRGKVEKYSKTSNKVEVYTPGSNYRTYNGSVVVRYWDDSATPKRIAPNQVDLEDVKVGMKYDTTDQKQAKIAYNGKTYELTQRVGGSEQGEVTRGTTFVDYYYKEVTPDPGKGNVIVHYRDEDGNTISNDIEDTPLTQIGTAYTTTDNKPNKIVSEDGVEYTIIPEKTKGEETGKVRGGTTEVTYVYKRITPKPETPTPTDNTIQPVKDIILNKDGQSVDGKSLLPNAEVSYTYKWDFDQYKGMKLTEEDKLKGFALIGDLQDKTVKLDFEKAKLTTVDGKEVKGLNLVTYNSVDEASEVHKALLKAAGITPEGDFYMWIPSDYVAFANDYVENGTSIMITIPVVAGDYTGTFNNKIWQIDMGNGYSGNVVENNIPKLEAIKDVVKEIGSKETNQNGLVEVGQKFPYVLDGAAINANVEGGLTEYKIRDDFDERYDQYDSEFYAFANQDIKLADGTIIKKDEEITRYFKQELIRDESGKVVAVEYTVDPQFLASIDEKEGIFDPRVYMMVTRVAHADNVENTFTVSINGYEITSNTVVTHTPKPEESTSNKPEEPKIPETPKPETPVSEVPAKPAERVLPNTGDASADSAAVLAGTMLLGFGLLGMAAKKKAEGEE